MRELSCEVDKLNYKYKLLIERKIVEDAIVQRLTEIGKKVKMPGFRSGHIPLPVLMKNFGESLQRVIHFHHSTYQEMQELKRVLSVKVLKFMVK